MKIKTFLFSLFAILSSLFNITVEAQSNVPESFTIDKTVYTQNEGTVTTTQWFNYDTFKEKKKYTYYVRQRDGIWQIYDYTVENLGTE